MNRTFSGFSCQDFKESIHCCGRTSCFLWYLLNNLMFLCLPLDQISWSPIQPGLPTVEPLNCKGWKRSLRSSSPTINPEPPLNHVPLPCPHMVFLQAKAPQLPQLLLFRLVLQTLPWLCALLWSHSSPSMSLWGAQNWTQDLRCGLSSAKFYRWHIHSLSGSLVQCLTTLTAKNFLLMSSLTLLSFCVKPFIPLVLSLHGLGTSLSPDLV